MNRILSYGSNMATEHIHARAPSAHSPTPRKLKDWELVFRCGYATIKPHEGKSVNCVVWSINDDDLENLDIYEGCPDFYSRVDTPFGSVYIMNPPYDDKLIYPTVEYIKSIKDGYDEFGFDWGVYMDVDEEFKEAMCR